ncbi:intradiol ring-cleavage dioxygenase [Phreatobacter stygius]|uniref:Hydroxyquinol 1,2-dioxygenase n=1 Tax=Phreatobacter stygius TaxID=1940610 RepID=A0A4D7B473_9HYPH|nr:intradiol ring-cleavage dioxygenase [Phreatobacter stygius]QCI65318.1 hydroxyquinol 1,2-dioxygenase [Phreatobacter stygius]
MLSFNEHNLSEEVVARFDGCDNPRLKQIVQALVRHSHAFVREVELTQDEWAFAIDYLTRTGHMCDDKRQEFILLSDVMGVSMLVDAINHRMPDGATETTVLGPFYLGEHRVTPHGADIAAGLDGEPMYVEGKVSTADGAPLAGAVIDIWHSDDDGFYDAQKSEADEASLRARFISDAAGRFHFKSIVPSSYPIPHDGPVGQLLEATKRHPMRPAHVHFHVSAPGFETLVTHVFISGDPWLESDAVFGVKESLIAALPGREGPIFPDGSPSPDRWRHLKYDFGLKAVGRRAVA